MSAALKKRSVVIAGHRTSLSLEDAFWQLLKRLAAERQISINALIEEIDENRSGNLSSAVRTFVLEQALKRSPEPSESESPASGLND